MNFLKRLKENTTDNDLQIFMLLAVIISYSHIWPLWILIACARAYNIVNRQTNNGN